MMAVLFWFMSPLICLIDSNEEGLKYETSATFIEHTETLYSMQT